MNLLVRALPALLLTPVACQGVRPEVPPQAEDPPALSAGAAADDEVFVLPGVPANAAPASEEEAFARLLAATRFTDDAEGYAGTLPPEVAGWRVLHASPRAGDWFRRLLEEGSVPGQLFALCGLYYADRPRFDAEIDAFRRIRALVPLQRGCTIYDAAVSSIVDCRSPNAVRLGKEHDTIRGFVDARPELPSVAYDIVGGAYPALFAERDGWPRRGAAATPPDSGAGSGSSSPRR